jgi:hypothetical protein
MAKSKWLLLWSLLQTIGCWGQVEGEEEGSTRKSEKSDQRLDPNVLYCCSDQLDGLGNSGNDNVTSSYMYVGEHKKIVEKLEQRIED